MVKFPPPAIGLQVGQVDRINGQRSSEQVGQYHAMLRHEVQVGQTRHHQPISIILEIESRLLVSIRLQIQFHGYLPLRLTHLELVSSKTNKALCQLNICCTVNKLINSHVTPVPRFFSLPWRSRCLLLIFAVAQMAVSEKFIAF